jgi:cytidylate kinase
MVNNKFMGDRDSKRVIAVDGFSSTGKSTLAKDIARHYKIRYIDSGAMYRAVTYYAMKNDIIDTITDHINEDRLKEALKNIELDFVRDKDTQIQFITLNGKNVEEQIRQMDVSNYVSYISKYPFVREKMVERQREFEKRGSLVMDGRDIGTVVFPNADVKFFVVADAGIRAQRRYKELKEKGFENTLEEVRKNIEERDEMDQNRKISPLRKAEDAIEFDNSHLTREEQLREAIKIIEKAVRS